MSVSALEHGMGIKCSEYVLVGERSSWAFEHASAISKYHGRMVSVGRFPNKMMK